MKQHLRRTGFVAAIAIAGAWPGAASAAGGHRFAEPFEWKGSHAATVHGTGTTVWWDHDDWDVRGDTHQIAVTPQGQSWTGYHVDIHKGFASLRNGAENNSKIKVGGDGSPGVGIMRLDFQGILSARLRNPILISSKRPAVVTFYAPQFVTTGHWWELALTPASKTTAGEFTAVPGRQGNEGLASPLTGREGGGELSTNGPGHPASAEDSVNLVSTGFPDAPECDGSGWHARYAVTSSIRGVERDFVNPRATLPELDGVDPRKPNELQRWKAEFKPNRATLFRARKSGKFERVDSWKVRIPWRESFLSLLYVAYQGDHHPQVGCGFGRHGIAQAQQMAWRQVEVSPVKYARTRTFPRETDARRDGWMSYDTRDLQRHGPAINGAPQANERPYDLYSSVLYCSQRTGGIVCPAPNARDSVTLPLELSAADVANAKRALVVADVKYPGTVRVSVNGKPVGALPHVPDSRPASPEGDFFDKEAWVRRSLRFDPKLLRRGANRVELSLGSDRQVQLERIQLELGYSR